jgi:glutaredoxin-like YruB-family protein
VLAYWAEFSDAAQRALRELEKFARESEDVPVFVVDVEAVNDIHKQFDVQRVPTVLTIEKGKETKRVEGVQSARFFEVHFGGATPDRRSRSKGEKAHNVVVYSGPGCPACSQLKNYLRQNGVRYREIDISRDQRAAEKISRRSGKMAVPQTDIDGNLVVGFDRSKLNRLLDIREEA